MTEKFDFEQALADLKAGKPITGKDSVLGPLVKQLTEAALEAEIDTHLAQEIMPNRKNGKTRKTMKSSSGAFELETPRDRSGTFEPYVSALSHLLSPPRLPRPGAAHRFTCQAA